MGLDIKICGLTNVDDAALACELGADFLGFVIYSRSPRAVTAATVTSIVKALPPETRCVGVFVNEPLDTVRRVVEDAGLYAAQIHGDESGAAFADVDFRLWRAVRMTGDRVSPEPSEWANAQRLVVDAAPPGVYGGAGETADWPAAAVLARQQPVMLAGGLVPENVAEAVATVAPAGVDVSSGVEAEPGRKDPARLKAFIENARGALSGPT